MPHAITCGGIRTAGNKLFFLARLLAPADAWTPFREFRITPHLRVSNVPYRTVCSSNFF